MVVVQGIERSAFRVLAGLFIVILHSQTSQESMVAEDPRLPNILFAISDDQSWNHCGANDCSFVNTPAFDAIAKEGVLFPRAFCAAPSCAPSRSAILTGRNIWELEEAGVLFGTLKSTFRPFTVDLGNAGYQLAATGKTWGPGVTRGRPLFARRPNDSNSIFGQPYNNQKLEKRVVGLNALDYAGNFEEFLNRRDPDRPFFFWYGATEPHQNYQVGRWKEFGRELEDVNLPPYLPDNSVTRGEFLDYGLEIEHFDQQLGRMIEMLRQRGILENTLIVVTSDHGNPMPRAKCNLYDSGVRVPLAIRWPKKIRGDRRIDDLVSLIDLAPTLLDAAGIKPPAAMSGKSLWSMLTSEKSGMVEGRDFVVTGFERHIICRRGGVGYPMRSIRTPKYAYIRKYEPDRWPAGDPDFLSSHQGYYGDCDRGETKANVLSLAQTPGGLESYRMCFGRRPPEELYDLENDPDQIHNLLEAGASVDRKTRDIRDGLRTRMNDYLDQTKDPRRKGQSPWDTYPFSDKRIFQNPKWKTEGLGLRSRRKSREER